MLSARRHTSHPQRLALRFNYGRCAAWPFANFLSFWLVGMINNYFPDPDGCTDVSATSLP